MHYVKPALMDEVQYSITLTELNASLACESCDCIKSYLGYKMTGLLIWDYPPPVFLAPPVPSNVQLFPAFGSPGPVTT